MTKINVDNILNGLKDFQLKTVDYVYDKLYSESYSDRFLIADEVGLGKTLVAKGIIGKIIESFQNNNNNDRLDIIYICSNVEIARQNINRINILDENVSHASRITLLPLKIFDLKNNDINFVSFTPGTSFNLRSNGGVKEERALIYDILSEVWNFDGQSKYINFFQCTAGETWERYLTKTFPKNKKIDDGLKESFIEIVNSIIENQLAKNEKTLRDNFEEVANEFANSNNVKHHINHRRYKIIGRLRELLAKSCISSLNPELIILDEFQRFKNLLDEEDEHNELARHIFNYEDVKVLLLSATPYKMYTMQHELEENHYKDFMETIKFLLNSEEKESRLKTFLNKYKSILYNISENNLEEKLSDLSKVKNKIETILKEIMVRNERVFASIDYEGMINEKRDLLGLSTDELEQYLALDKVTKKLDVRNNIEYWKSSPYLLSFMENNYKLKEKFNIALGNGLFKDLSAQLKKLSLSAEEIEHYKKIDPANSRLNNLIVKSIESGGWKLLWVPPSMSYYSPSGIYAESSLEGFSKDLIFSAWHVVPRVISSMVSYEAERRMVEEFDKDAIYSTERKDRSQLLNFTKSDDRLNGMPLFNMLYPSEFLAKEVNPLKIVEKLNDYNFNNLPNKHEVINYTSKYLHQFLDKIGEIVDYDNTNKEDQRWYWLAPLMLDQYFSDYSKEKIIEFLVNIDISTLINKADENTTTGFEEHINYLKSAIENPNSLKLGTMPDDLADVIAKTALGSPSISAKRALSKKFNVQSKINHVSLEIGFSFRNMFNISENITLIRGLDSRKEPYWLKVLEYSIEGNIQSLLDEYIHILFESLGLFNLEDVSAMDELKETFINAISLRTVSLNFDEIKCDVDNFNNDTNNSLRCRYALRFSKGKSYQDFEITRQSQVREAFNSPFKPFILATTSIGQEGLDFHQYCRSIIHWNLPANPVDLEQREGRIHRYKGFVIRNNLAKKYSQWLIKNNNIDKDPWEILFSKAKEDRDQDINDLIPFWIFETDNGYQIDRHIPFYPLSKEEYKLSKLKKALAVYRMAFGQARQEDLIDFINNNISSERHKELIDHRIDLSP